MLCIKVPFEGKIELDGRPVGCVPAGMAKAICLEKGKQEVKIEMSRAEALSYL